MATILKRKTPTIAALLLFLFIAAMVAAIYYLFDKVQTSSEELLLLRENSSLMQEKIEQFSDSKERYNALSEDLEKVRSLFVDSEVPVAFLQYLEKSALESNLSTEVSLTRNFPEFTPGVTAPALRFQISDFRLKDLRLQTEKSRLQPWYETPQGLYLDPGSRKRRLIGTLTALSSNTRVLHFSNTCRTGK